MADAVASPRRNDVLPSFLRGTERAIEVQSKVLSAVAGVGLVLLVLLTTADVTRRKLLGASIPSVVEITEVALVAVVFLGMLGAHTSGRHIQTPLVTNRLPARASHGVRTVGLLLALALVGWITYATAVAAVSSVETGEFRYGLSAIPIWPARIAIPVGLAFFELGLLLKTITTVGSFVRGDAARLSSVESNL